MQGKAYSRICDLCGSPYDMNNRIIPRIIVFKKIEVDDITFRDVYAEPDYCDLCVRVIIKLLQKKKSLSFHVSELLADRIPRIK